jgi:hypothetical protein
MKVGSARCRRRLFCFARFYVVPAQEVQSLDVSSKQSTL